MSGKIRVRAKIDGGITEVKALMRHPMETGQRKDESGNKIPAKYITDVKAVLNDRVLMQAHWGAAISQNPFVGFRFSGGNTGDTVTVKWLDNTGATGEGSATIR